MSAGHLASMSNTAFAGFLRLLLTPLNQAPVPSAELQAYLRYLNEVAPGDRGAAAPGSAAPRRSAAGDL